MIRASLEDVVIDRSARTLIPGFQDVRRGAMEAGALGCSIRAPGPRCSPWTPEAAAPAVLGAMRGAFGRLRARDRCLGRRVRSAGARLIA